MDACKSVHVLVVNAHSLLFLGHHVTPLQPIPCNRTKETPERSAADTPQIKLWQRSKHFCRSVQCVDNRKWWRNKPTVFCSKHQKVPSAKKCCGALGIPAKTASLWMHKHHEAASNSLERETPHALRYYAHALTVTWSFLKLESQRQTSTTLLTTLTWYWKIHRRSSEGYRMTLMEKSQMETKQCTTDWDCLYLSLDRVHFLQGIGTAHQKQHNKIGIPDRARDYFKGLVDVYMVNLMYLDIILMKNDEKSIHFP